MNAFSIAFADSCPRSDLRGRKHLLRVVQIGEKIDLLKMSGGSQSMNGPPQEGRSQDRRSSRLSLGRVHGSHRAGTNMGLGISLFASAAQLRSTCARPRDVVSGGVNAPPFSGRARALVADCRKWLHIRTIRFCDHDMIASRS